MGCKICDKCTLQCCFTWNIFNVLKMCVMPVVPHLPFYVLTCKPQLTNGTFDIYLALYFKGNMIGAMATFIFFCMCSHIFWHMAFNWIQYIYFQSVLNFWVVVNHISTWLWNFPCVTQKPCLFLPEDFIVYILRFSNHCYFLLFLLLMMKIVNFFTSWLDIYGYLEWFH